MRPLVDGGQGPLLPCCKHKQHGCFEPTARHRQECQHSNLVVQYNGAKTGSRSRDDTSLTTSSGLCGLLLAPEPEALAVALGATLVFLVACSSFSALAGAAFLVGLRLDGICSGMFELFAITFRGALQLCAYIHAQKPSYTYTHTNACTRQHTHTHTPTHTFVNTRTR